MLNLSPDFAAVADGLESVALRRDGTPGEQVVPGALRRQVEIREAAASGGRVLQNDVVWHLPNEQLSHAPRLGDRIVDAQRQSWTVIDVRFSPVTNRWHCHARCVRIAAGLDQLVSVQRAAWSKDRHGAPRADWSEVAASLPARVQLVSGARSLLADRRFCRATFRVYLAETIAVQLDDMLVDPRGCMFRVIGFRQPDQLAAPFELDAELAWHGD